MPRRSEPDDEPGLFDLPLEREPAPPAPRAAGAEERRARSSAAAPPPPQPLAAPPVSARLVAGLADLLVHAAVAVGAVAGVYLLGVRPQLEDWPPLAVLLFTFSFLYSVVPLAFWGQTLGMAWMGLVATTPEGEALTFEQTALRWLGGLLTCATLGLPLLFARRRSPADWLSGSITARRR